MNPAPRSASIGGATPGERRLSVATMPRDPSPITAMSREHHVGDHGRSRRDIPASVGDAGSVPRVLLITGEYPPTVGGVGDYTATLAAHLRAGGAHVGILTGREPGGAAEVGVARTVADWGPGSWGAIVRAIREERPDVIHIQYQAGAFDGRGAINLLPWRLARRGPSAPPMVVTFHDLRAPYLFPKAGPLRPRALRFLAHSCAATVATNGDDWAQLRDDPALATRLRLIPIGSNIPPLPVVGRMAERAATRAALGLGPGTILIAYFGLVSAGKGVATLLDALGRARALGLADYHLLLIGGEASATDRATFADGCEGGGGGGRDLAGALAAAGLAAHATVTGALPADAVAAHLAAADLIALPFLDGASWRRGSLLAALASGVPTITTTPPPGHDARGQLPRLRDDAGVLLVPPADAAALATALVRLVGDAPLRARLATTGRALAAAFDWATIARAHSELYSALAVASRQGRQGGGSQR